MAKVSFDGINKVISVTQVPVEGYIDIDVQIDLYSDWKEWILISDNAKYLQAMRIVGGDPLPGSKQLGTTYFLMNGWRIRPYEGNQVLRVNGNLYTEEGDSPFVATLGSYNVMISNTVSSLVDSTVQQLPEIEYASFGGGVSIDVINGIPGTAYPIGTLQDPVNNLTDALTIANTRGFKVLFILEPMTLGEGIITNFKLIGRSHVLTEIVMQNALQCSGVTIDNCNVCGILDGGTHIINCIVGNVSYVNGHIHDSGLQGTIYLDGDLDAVIMNCNAIDPYSLPIIDMSGSGQNCTLSDWSGHMTFKNMTGDQVGDDANTLSVQMDGGKVVLDPSINTPTGIIEINGIGLIENNATQYASLNTDGLLNREQLARPTWTEVYINPDNGESGTTFPVGTTSNPVNNLTDALTIAENNHIEQFRLHGDITLTGDWSEYTFNANSYERAHITCDNAILDKTVFNDLTFSGTCASGELTANECNAPNGFTNANLIMDNTQMAGMFTLQSGGTLRGDRCSAAASCVINMNGSTGDLQMGNFSGVMTIVNCTNPTSFIGVSGHYVITLMNTCTAGTAMISGIGILDNQNNGMTVIDMTVPKVIWDQVIEGTFDARSVMKLMGSVLASKSTGGGGTTITFRDLSDTKDRITATVDQNGNRTGMTLDTE